MSDVSFCRPLFLGVSGTDVIGHKRALSRWNPDVYKWHKFSPHFGEYFEKAVLAFQNDWNRHNPKEHIDPTGRIGLPTHNALEKTKNKNGNPVFDVGAAKLCSDFCKKFEKSPEDIVREGIVAAAFFWYQHRAAISYSQTRPFQVLKPPDVPNRWDCSGFATNCHLAAGAPNPNGNVASGLGYTGTLMSHGRKVETVSQLKQGDLIFYGFSSGGGPAFNRGDPTHVAVYVGNNMVVSNGHYPMGYYSYNYRSDLNHYRTYNVTPEV